MQGDSVNELPSFEEQVFFSYGIIDYKHNSVFVEPTFVNSLRAARNAADDLIKEKMQQDHSILLGDSELVGFPEEQTDIYGEKHISSIQIDQFKSLIVEENEMSLDIFLKTKYVMPFIKDSFIQIYKFFITEHITDEHPRQQFLDNLQERLKKISSLV